MKKRIVITGGGTLGHILPIVPVIEKLHNQYDFIYIGSSKGVVKKYFEDKKIDQLFIKLYYLDMNGINRKNIFKNIKTMIKYFKCKKLVKRILNKNKVSLSIGMGGYISGVVIHLSIKAHIRTIIHEQNSVMGLANLLVYKKVDQVLLSYPINNIRNKNIKVIGNPRYSYVKENIKSYDNYNSILIMGGSLGSNKINDTILNNVDKLVKYNISLITGEKYYQENILEIKNIENIYLNIHIIAFANNILDIMKNSSLIISRSGATTISEIIALKKCSILVPSPNVTENHQFKNALYLQQNDCCILIEEENLEKELFNKIDLLFTNYFYKKTIERNLEMLVTNNPLEEFIKTIKELV